MTLRMRRLAVVSLTALALAGGGAGAASAAAPPAPAVGSVGADTLDDDWGHHHDHHHDRPLYFGPFEVPRQGQVSGGVSWDARH
ncbi:hypothetical protein ABZ626_09635 [Streptomyces longispororuber]|uniref:hypothetical protein n=1 Tax=Streptomyces longispororuber TaxID=68230 RepID=UPI0033CE2629